MQAFFGSTPQNYNLDIFTQQTADNPFVEQNPPNIVLAVMESIGSHLFEFDTPERDLLGALRPHWQQDWLFKRFVPEGTGTISTLNRFFVRSPVDKISQSSNLNTVFKSNMFQPFIDNGYKIIYITAGYGGWRNLNQFLPQLGVSEFIEQNALMKMYPEAKAYTWGVGDEYMFKYAVERLKQAQIDGERVMIMMMSITNHAPYRIPDTAEFHNYSLSNAELERLSGIGSKSEILNMLNTFHYSNDSLGKFISAIEDSSLAANTIIAATGDHNIRGIAYPDLQELVLSYAVPFYLSVPKAYQHNTVYDKTRIGSHKDIFPTLYELALSNSNYYHTGCNILAPELDPLWCQVGYNPEILIDENGAYLMSTQQFYPWVAPDSLLVKDESNALKEQQPLSHWRSFSDVLLWQLNQQVQ